MAAFVGREQDLETVGRYFQDAAQGKGSVVFITGEAGIGKTTFINEFKARYVDAQNAASKNKKTPDIRFAEAKCSELIGKGEAYAPFIELIGRLVADDKAFGSSKLADVVREIGADWFELVPVIGKALKLVSTTFFKWQSADDARQLADRKGNKEKLVQQYVQILKTMSEKHPLVLFVDDLHWADDSSIYLLFQLAREIQDRRILILGTYRPTDIQAVRGEKAHPLKDALGEMHRFGVCKEVKLGYFTPDHIRRYLDATFPQNRLDAAFVAYLRDLTEGNPLFVTEQVKLLQEIGKIAPAPQTSQVSETCEVSPVWELRGTLRDADMPIPTSVEKTIEKRFERLKEDMQETLQYASVSGEQFDAAVVAQMLQQDELAVLKKLQTLDRVYEFVKEQRADGRPTRGAVYQFIHSLVQKSLYGTLSDGIKVKLHAKAAEIIETLYPEQREAFAEELAAHWERGREYAKAAPYLLLSARKANRQSGYQEAKTHSQRGLEMLKSAGFPTVETHDGRTPHVETHGRASLPKTPDQAMLRLQIELLLELATAEEAIGEAKNSIGHAEIAVKLGEMIQNQSIQGEVFYQLGNLLIANSSSKDIEQIINILEKSLKFKIMTQDHEGFFKVLERMFEPCRSIGKGEFFIEQCQKVIHANQTANRTDVNPLILKLKAMMLYDLGKYSEVYNSIENGLQIVFTTENADPHTQMDLLEYATNLKNSERFSIYYEKSKNIAYSMRDERNKAQIFQKLGAISRGLGKYDDALEFYIEARNIAHEHGDKKFEVKVLSILRSNLKIIGKFDEALKYGNEGLKIAQQSGLFREALEAFEGLEHIFRCKGDYTNALAINQEILIMCQKSERYRSVAYHSFLRYKNFNSMGKFDEATDSLTQALQRYRELKHVTWEGIILSYLALCHFSLGHIDKALSLIDEALQINKKSNDKRLFIPVLSNQSQIFIGIGKYQDAAIILETVMVDVMERGNMAGQELHESCLNYALLCLLFDEIDKTLKRLNQIEILFKEFVFMEGIAMLKDAYTQVYLAQGDLEKAETSLNEAIALFQQMNSFRLGEADLTLAALRLAQCQPSAALEAASAARKIFTDIEYYRAGEAILWQAKALFALRRIPDAQTRLKESAAEFKRLQQPHHLAEAQLLYGQLLAVAGQHEKALRNMLKAKATFAKLGLKRLEREAEPLIAQISQMKDNT